MALSGSRRGAKGKRFLDFRQLNARVGGRARFALSRLFKRALDRLDQPRGRRLTEMKLAKPHRHIPVFVESARVRARSFLAPKIGDWLQKLPQQGGIYLASENLPYEHPEDDYDSQYGKEHL